MKIEIVPHPSKFHVMTPDGKRGLYWCEACQERTVEAFNRPSYRKVKCDKCQKPCEPLMETLFKDQMGIAVDGAVVAYCKAEPDGWMSRCQSQPMPDYWRKEIKAVVDAQYGGDAVWTDGSMVVLAPNVRDEEEAEDEKEPEGINFDEDHDT